LAATQTVVVLVAWGLGVLVLKRPKASAGAVLLAAVAIRFALLWTDPSLSDDLFRYLWEGRVVAEGANPYLAAPGAAVWDTWASNDMIREAVNHPEVPSVYPPLALGLFAALGKISYSPLVIRVFVGGCDALVAYFLARVLDARGRSRDGAWLYALLPLGAVEAAVSGHLEAVAILPLVIGLLAWERGRSSIGWVGLAGLVKLLPVLILPALWRRSPWLYALVAGVAVLTALPFVDAGGSMAEGLTTYARDWSFNGSFYRLLEPVLGEWTRAALGVMGAAAVGFALWRHRDPARVALWVGGAFVLLSPTVHPWYVLWAWVPALVVGVRAWTLLAWLAPVAYIVLGTLDPTTGQWQEAAWPAVVQYLPFLLALGVESARHWTQPGPWAPGPEKVASRSLSRT
jgi:hypothetical protein